MPKQSFREKFIGDKAFYKSIFGITLPIMVQNAITNFVNMLDNIMVGRVGTEPMSGVSIANQLMFVYMLCVFGGLGGIGIFTAQFYGKKDHEGLRSSFRAKVWLALILTILAVVVMLGFGDRLLNLFLNDEGAPESMERTLQYGLSYMHIIMLSFPATALINIYASTLRECSETVLPMKAGIVSVLVNLCLNYILIYGKFGAPALGVNGAAIATVIAKYVEITIILVWVSKHHNRFPWFKGIYSSMRVPAEHIKSYIKKGTPLLANEALWSFGMTILTQCYSMRGLSAIASMNIANTLYNLLNVVYMSMGNAVGIIVGQLLGAGKLQEAKDKDNKIIFFSVVFSFATTILVVIAAPFFPLLYNTTDDVRHLASSILIVDACCTPVYAFVHCAYFTLRSGGKTVITFLFDCVFTWAFNVPLAFVLSRYTSLGLISMLIAIESLNLIKVAIGYILVKKNTWINNMVSTVS